MTRDDWHQAGLVGATMLLATWALVAWPAFRPLVPHAPARLKVHLRAHSAPPRPALEPAPAPRARPVRPPLPLPAPTDKPTVSNQRKPESPAAPTPVSAPEPAATPAEPLIVPATATLAMPGEPVVASNEQPAPPDFAPPPPDDDHPPPTAYGDKPYGNALVLAIKVDSEGNALDVQIVIPSFNGLDDLAFALAARKIRYTALNPPVPPGSAVWIEKRIEYVDRLNNALP